MDQSQKDKILGENTQDEKAAEEKPEEQSILEKKVHKMVANLERKIITPEAAAMLLFAAAVFGILSAGFVYIQDDGGMDTRDPSSGSVAGYVADHLGNPVQNALVSIAPGGLELRTDNAGYYYFPSVLPGNYDLSATAPGYKVQVYRIDVDGFRPQMHMFALEQGVGVIYEDRTLPPPSPSFGDIKIFIGTLFLFGAISALVASFLTIRKKRFKTALFFAVMGVLSYGFLAGSILAGIAAVFIMTEKHQYGGKKEELLCKMCRKMIKKSEGYVECRCSETYHITCASGNKCLICNQNFTEMIVSEGTQHNESIKA
ncbi:MAG: carboxypeptidase regulatory-like domain-containing protein [Candidatus Thermoplasmatota archaeon]|nr:carboxypeptidase regulatory-like domain-containing protein [Candidatus Thermoplasmatota archaeon]